MLIHTPHSRHWPSLAPLSSHLSLHWASLSLWAPLSLYPQTPPPPTPTPENVYNFSDPNLALSHWIDLFIDVINKHATLKKKRVKHQILPPWLNTDIKQAMLLRDKFRKQKKFVEYKQQRHRVNYLVREAKKKYFNDLADNKADVIHVESDQHTH